MSLVAVILFFVFLGSFNNNDKSEKAAQKQREKIEMAKRRYVGPYRVSSKQWRLAAKDDIQR